jgi:hypothetical protein
MAQNATKSNFYARGDNAKAVSFDAHGFLERNEL